MTSTKTPAAVAALVAYLDAQPDNGIDDVQAAYNPATGERRKFATKTLMKAGEMRLVHLNIDVHGHPYAMKATETRPAGIHRAR